MSLRRNCPNWNASWSPDTCQENGCCYDPNPNPDPAGIPWCFEPAGLAPSGGFHNDQDLIVRASSSDPLVDWIDQGDWAPGDHCNITGKVVAQIPLPNTFTTTCSGNNNAMALLLPDNQTITQMQPAYRAFPSPDSPLLAVYQGGCPVPFPWQVSILSDSPWGAHGGSGLSSIGGTIRSGELRPGAAPLQHALKLELFAHDYYFSNGTSAPYEECFRWPALGCDGYAHDDQSPLAYNGTVSGLQPGALLALQDVTTVRVTTAPGLLIRDALYTYGGYIVDDTAWDAAAICLEPAVSDELLQDYNITSMWPPIRPGYNNATTAFFEDLVNIFRALSIVDNNRNGTVGGGGVSRAPMAPPICGV